VPKSTGTKPTGSGRRSTRSNGSSISPSGRRKTVLFTVCVERGDADGDLQVARLYRRVPDKAAAEKGYVRVIDDSGEDYLYPAKYFETARLPEAAARRVELHWARG